MKFYSPLRYPGGKNCIFKFVSSLFHENDLVGYSYAEPYAGGCGLALRLLFEEYVENIYINDLDVAIYAFWVSILERNDDFCSWLESVDINIDTWKKCKKIYESKDKSDLFELAKATFFLNRTNVSGVIKGGVIGGVEQKGKYKIDARFKKDALIERIQKIARYKNRIFISNDDGVVFTKKMNEMTENVFIYLDPPYYEKGADLYMNYFSDDDHKNLSEYVKVMNKKWMVSYDNSEVILNLYAEASRVIYQLSQSASNRVGDEILMFADTLSFKESILELNNPVLL